MSSETLPSDGPLAVVLELGDDTTVGDLRAFVSLVDRLAIAPDRRLTVLQEHEVIRLALWASPPTEPADPQSPVP